MPSRLPHFHFCISAIDPSARRTANFAFRVPPCVGFITDTVAPVSTVNCTFCPPCFTIAFNSPPSSKLILFNSVRIENALLYTPFGVLYAHISLPFSAHSILRAPPTACEWIPHLSPSLVPHPEYPLLGDPVRFLILYFPVYYFVLDIFEFEFRLRCGLYCLFACFSLWDFEWHFVAGRKHYYLFV